MSSFKATRDVLLESYDNGDIDDEEFLVLTEENTSKNPEFDYKAYEPFDFDSIDTATFKAEFRFEKNDIEQLMEALDIPGQFQCPNRSVCDAREALCMALKRLAYPCRYSDMMVRFGGKPISVLCLITNEVVDFIYDNHSHRLTQWNPTLLSPQQLRSYADAIAAKGAALDNCFGFVDGTVRPICRPGQNQRLVYNGHKRVHAIKFQSVTLPNGMIANMYGPVGKHIIILYVISHVKTFVF